ncbi:Serine/threonine-protein kinase PknD [Planctomycetes bacterium Pla163]|uniref:Serine/threonine-protein kinase PknD n=1 Tax=Rohdeia mirabilis TaxID=2528008 RepID=A0A518CV88_9BACT|nr:Serine/threonine-protein kinase PknD [Planctomycetes bacterium Pla163]
MDERPPPADESNTADSTRHDTNTPDSNAGDAAPSLIGRIGAISGAKFRVLLRDERTGDTPVPLTDGSASDTATARNMAADGDTPTDATASAQPHPEAGKYLVQGEIGRGGVGTVNKGHDQDLGRDVAMKFLREEFRNEPRILHRFVEEAQIGGQLQHPGIVPVYDLGTIDGRPFFSMKLIKGQTLAKLLEERAATATDRGSFLRLFEDVCQTLAYAHSRGVVHRDLKPANIMVGSFGEVQVVDWGMGKVLDAEGTQDSGAGADAATAPTSSVGTPTGSATDSEIIATVRTGDSGTKSVMGSVMGTPAYMPPEQARGDVTAMDERSDVFSLGAILCEILTGAPPYVGDVTEVITQAMQGELDDAHDRLAACGADPEMVELARRCLQAESAARPASAAVVAQAVHDHLAAVEARVHDARVEAAEAEVRAAALKRTLTLAAGLAVVIAAGLFASLWFWKAAEDSAERERLARLEAVESAENERVAKLAAEEAERVARASEQVAIEQTQVAVEQTAVARRELERAVEIKGLITAMLQSVTPAQAKRADTTLLEGILDTTAARLAEGEVEDELVAAELNGLTSYVYRAIGAYPKSEEHGLAALEAYEAALGAEHPRTLDVLNNVALVLLEQGRYAEAEPLLRRAIDAQERALGPDHIDTQVSASYLARLLELQGRYPEAEVLARDAYDVLEQQLGEDDSRTLGCQSVLATVFMRMGRFDEAEELFEQILAIEVRDRGEEHPNTLATSSNLANIYVFQERYDEAEPIRIRLLEADRAIHGEEHPSTIRSLGNLALLRQGQGRLDEAESLFLETLELAERVFGEDHPDTLTAVSSLAIVLRTQGRLDEAEPLLLRVLEIERRDLGEEHRSTLGTTTNLGKLYNDMGRYEDAAALFEISLPIKRRVLGPTHPWTGVALSGLMQAYMALGRMEEALELERELVDIDVAYAEQSDDPETLASVAWSLLTHAAEELRDPQRARGLAERACELAEEAGSERLWIYLDTLGMAQHGSGDSAAAVETQRRVIELMPNTPYAGEMRARLAEYEAAAGDS